MAACSRRRSPTASATRGHPHHGRGQHLRARPRQLDPDGGPGRSGRRRPPAPGRSLLDAARGRAASATEAAPTGRMPYLPGRDQMCAWPSASEGIGVDPGVSVDALAPPWDRGGARLGADLSRGGRRRGRGVDRRADPARLAEPSRAAEVAGGAADPSPRGGRRDPRRAWRRCSTGLRPDRDRQCRRVGKRPRRRRTGLDAWERMLSVNLTGVFLTFVRGRATARKSPDWGALIAVASTAGLKGYPTSPPMRRPSTPWWAGNPPRWNRAHAAATANALCPGFLDTEMTGAAWPTSWRRRG